jgi:uncharacterized protein (TIRG00374 family)
MSKKVVSPLLTLLFLAVFIWYGLTNRDMFEALKHVALWALIAVAFGRLLTYVNNGLFTKWTVEAFTGKLKLAEGTYIAILSAIGNFFGPLLGGTSIRAVHLKKTHSLSYSNFTATLAGYYLIIFIANSVLAIVSLLFLKGTRETDSLLGFFAIWLAVLVALIFVRLPGKKRFDKITTRNKYINTLVTIIYDIEDGWHILVKNRWLMMRLMFLGFFGFVITFFLTLVEFDAIHVHIQLAALGFYTSLVTVSMLLSLTPGAIGIREAILLFVAGTLGVTTKEILQVAVIDRGINFVVLLALFALIRTPIIKKKLAPENAPI